MMKESVCERDREREIEREREREREREGGREGGREGQRKEESTQTREGDITSWTRGKATTVGSTELKVRLTDALEARSTEALTA
jgi:hypothetical protein